VTDYSSIKLMYEFKIREELDLIISDIPQIYENIIETQSVIKQQIADVITFANITAKYHYDKRYKFLIFVSDDFAFLRFYNDYFLNIPNNKVNRKLNI
jgi:hypothetical protein